jgi:outer membrane receptor protein involved in Fe transport
MRDATISRRSGQIPLDEVATGRLDRFGLLTRKTAAKFSRNSRRLFSQRMEFGRDAQSRRISSALAFRFMVEFYVFSSRPALRRRNSAARFAPSGRRKQSNTCSRINFSAVKQSSPSARIFISIKSTSGFILRLPEIPNRKFLPENLSNPDVLLTSAQANVNNYAGYVQNGMDFFNGHLHVEAGLRWDYFSFEVTVFELSDTETISEAKKARRVFSRN